MNRATLAVIAMVVVAITIHVAAVAYRDRHPKPASHLADAITRVAAGWTTLGLVAIAGAISYNHLYTLAAGNGQTAWRASAFPLSVDGVEVVASLVLLNARRRNRPAGWLPWFAFVIAGVASLIANVAVAPDHPVARIIAAWPAVALVIASKMFFGLLDEPAHHTPAPLDAVAVPAVDAEPVVDLAIVVTPASADAPIAAPPTELTPPAQNPTTPPTPNQATPAPTEPAGQRATTPPGDSSSAGIGNPPNEGTAIRLPVDVMRRIPVQQDRYDNWRRLWQQLQEPGSDLRATAQDSGLSLRTIQFVRSAGEAGFLDSAIPPAHRMLTLNDRPHTSTPPPPLPATTPVAPVNADPGTAEQPQEQLADATAELLAGIDQVLEDAAAIRP